MEPALLNAAATAWQHAPAPNAQESVAQWAERFGQTVTKVVSAYRRLSDQASPAASYYTAWFVSTTDADMPADVEAKIAAITDNLLTQMPVELNDACDDIVSAALIRLFGRVYEICRNVRLTTEHSSWADLGVLIAKTVYESMSPHFSSSTQSSSAHLFAATLDALYHHLPRFLSASITNHSIFVVGSHDALGASSTLDEWLIEQLRGIDIDSSLGMTLAQPLRGAVLERLNNLWQDYFMMPPTYAESTFCLVTFADWLNSTDEGQAFTLWSSDAKFARSLRACASDPAIAMIQIEGYFDAHAVIESNVAFAQYLEAALVSEHNAMRQIDIGKLNGLIVQLASAFLTAIGQHRDLFGSLFGGQSSEHAELSASDHHDIDNSPDRQDDQESQSPLEAMRASAKQQEGASA